MAENVAVVFEEIKTALAGTTILAQPRVSRDTIISVLHTHTDLIHGLRKDLKALTIRVAEIDVETQSNKKHIKALEAETQILKKDVKNLYRLSDEFRQEMDELSQQVAELYVLKKQVAEQKESLETLTNRFNDFTIETRTFVQETTKTVNTVQTLCNETQFQLKEIKDYVDHFGDNLILNSQQIIVDTHTGFSNRPITLTEALRVCRSNFDDIAQVDKTQDERLDKVFAEIDTKAPDSILFNIATLEKKVGTIELHIQKEEEQGLGALRKTCEELNIHMQAVQVDLADKIDRESVGFIVQEKYEEIVRYLQDALQSSIEDEHNFKQKADEIQEMVILLSNSKADRTEIANMQEVMVKSEALLKKVGAQANVKEKIKELVSRKELEQLLHSKVDRAELEQQLKSAMSDARRNRRLSATATTLQPVQDEAMNANFGMKHGNYSGGESDYHGGDGHGGHGGHGHGHGHGHGQGQGGQMSVSVNNRPNSKGSKQRKGAGGAGGGGSATRGGATSPSRLGSDDEDMQFDDADSSNGYGGGHLPSVHNASHKQGMQGSKSTPLLSKTLPGVEQGRLHGTIAPPVIALGQGIIPPNSASSGTRSAGDFASFVKSKGGKSGTAGGGGGVGGKGNNPGNSSVAAVNGAAMFPNAGGFRSASEGGKPGGLAPPNTGSGKHGVATLNGVGGYGSAEFPYVSEATYPMNYVEQSQLTDHLSYLNGSVSGGGFNPKAGHLLKALPQGSSVAVDDIEGKGKMLQGIDGKLYYQDNTE